MSKIEKVNIALTNRCNLKCAHCDIWRQTPKVDLAPQLLARLLRSDCLSKDLDLTLTGGEPFLHPQIRKVLDIIIALAPGALKTVSTNGLLRKEILEFLHAYGKLLPPDFSLHISLDGIKRHKAMRGIPAGVIMENLRFIRRSAPQVPIKIKFTITPLNYTDIIPVYSYAKVNGMDFKIKLIEYAAHYTNRMSKPSLEFDAKAKKEIEGSLSETCRLESRNSKSAHFIKNTISLLQGKKAPSVCKAPFERIFLFPDGEVYSCIHFASIGNLKEAGLTKIWNARKAEVIRSKVRTQGCNRCVAFHGFQE